MWKFVTPTIISLVLLATFYGYTPLKYGDYTFPMWANCLGWWVTSASVAFIPIVAFSKILTAPGKKGPQIARLLKPSDSWGPATDQDRMRAEHMWASKGYEFTSRQLKGNN